MRTFRSRHQITKVRPMREPKAAACRAIRVYLVLGLCSTLLVPTTSCGARRHCGTCDGAPADLRYRSFTFPAARPVTTLPYWQASDTERGTIERVIEVSGRVLASWKDSLLISPAYLRVLDSTKTAGIGDTVLVAHTSRALPELVLLIRGEGLVETEYHSSKKRGERMWELSLLIIPALLGALFLGKAIDIFEKK